MYHWLTGTFCIWIYPDQLMWSAFMQSMHKIFTPSPLYTRQILDRLLVITQNRYIFLKLCEECSDYQVYTILPASFFFYIQTIEGDVNMN